nr:RNA-directed DNA polymerase, eukaryota, reverse transcriptase zinc-binding domain protein [Tanacetum cinerariifolium]
MRDLRDKRMFWDYLAHVINQWDAEVVTMDDFNEVPLGGSLFTWCYKSATKMSKLDRPISLIGSIYKIIKKILTTRLVGVLENIVNEVQSAFIAERQSLDGPFILNEVLQWCKPKKKQSLIFKAMSSRGSIVINGSPTEEFQFFKGVKQEAGMLMGIKLSPSLNLSHMFYADDAVFVGQWHDSGMIYVTGASLERGCR